MTDEQLKTYLPSYGDRLAVLGFCRQSENSHNTRKSKQNCPKEKLVMKEAAAKTKGSIPH